MLKKLGILFIVVAISYILFYHVNKQSSMPVSNSQMVSTNNEEVSPQAVLTQEAMHLGKNELDKYVIKCGKYWYWSVEYSSSVKYLTYNKAINGHLVTNESDLGQADKMNGVEWDGYFSYVFDDVYRDCTIYSNEKMDCMNQWETERHSMYRAVVHVNRKNGKWTVNMVDTFNPLQGNGLDSSYREITCNDIPAPLKQEPSASGTTGN
jgi:hypothetical protein